LDSAVSLNSDLRKDELAMPGKKTENYRPDFSSERAPHINKLATV
jgi:hypothetical protein